MSYRLRITLNYTDGTHRDLAIECPPEVAGEVMNKGLVSTRVYVDSNLVITNPGLFAKSHLKIDKFKGAG